MSAGTGRPDPATSEQGPAHDRTDQPPKCDPEATALQNGIGGPLLTTDELLTLGRLLARLHITAPEHDLDPIETVSRIVNARLYRRAASERLVADLDPGGQL